MTTIGSVNIGKVAAIAAPQVASNNNQNQAKETSHASTANQIANISQVAANSIVASLGPDKTRGVQKPARPEAGFSTNQDEEHKAKGDSEEEKAEDIAKQSPARRKGLDLKA